MSQVRQVSLLPAGCQPWNIDVCAASGDRFAYCATLAVYIYQVRKKLFGTGVGMGKRFVCIWGIWFKLSNQYLWRIRCKSLAYLINFTQPWFESIFIDFPCNIEPYLIWLTRCCCNKPVFETSITNYQGSIKLVLYSILLILTGYTTV